MNLTAIRHTSVGVPSGICYGITDVPVASTFPEEAARIQEQLGNRKFDRIYSSPLKRCTQLASTLFPEENISLDERLKELDFGDWEMQSWDFVFNSSEGKIWFQDFTATRSPGGESFQDQINRVASFLNDLKTELFEEDLLVVHAGVIRALMCLLQAVSPEKAFDTRVDHGQVFNFKL